MKKIIAMFLVTISILSFSFVNVFACDIEKKKVINEGQYTEPEDLGSEWIKELVLGHARVINVSSRSHLNVRSAPLGEVIGKLGPNEQCFFEQYVKSIYPISLDQNYWYLVRYKVNGTNFAKKGWVSWNYLET